MGDNRRTVQITAIFLVCALAFFREPLRYAGFVIEEGLVLVFENTSIFEAAIAELQGYNAVKMRLRSNGVVKAYNYQIVFTVFDRTYRESILEEFMERSDFLPIIAVKSLIPPELKRFKNIILIDNYNTDPLRSTKRLRDFKCFIDYIANDPDKFVNELCCQRKACEPDDRKWHSDIPSALGVIAGMVCDYVHDSYGINSCDNRIDKEIKGVCDFMISAFYRDDTDVNLDEAVCRAIANYLDRHSEILIGAEDQQEDEFWIAFEEHKGIVFDPDYYYLDEVVLKKQHLNYAMSFQRIA